MHVTVSVKLSNSKFGEYSYSVNKEQFELLKSGSQVIVNVNNQLKFATVKAKSEVSDFEFKLKPIITIYKAKPLNNYQSHLANEIYINSICSLVDIQNIFTVNIADSNIDVEYYSNGNLIGNFKQLRKDPDIESYEPKCVVTNKEQLKTYQYVKLGECADDNKLTDKQQIVFDYLHERELESIPNVIENTGISRGVINTMIKNEILQVELLSKQFETLFDLDWHSTNQLSSEQRFAYECLIPGQNLLHGVSSSGKTEVYVEVIKKQLAEENQSLIVVPSVMLAVQVVGRLQKVFGDQVLIYHHMLSEGEKLSYRQQIENGSKNVIISTFEGLFLPFNNLGYVIFDEAHSNNYKVSKQININKQVVIDGLIKQGIDVLLGTATPLISDYAMTEYNSVNLITLTNRFGASEFPEVKFTKPEEDVISSELRKLITINKQRNKPTIIFFNKSGYASQVLCKDCYHLHLCPHCNKPLSYSKRFNRLECKYDGYSSAFNGTCNKCKSTNVKYVGIGIEQFTVRIKQLYPDLTIASVDGKSKTDELYSIMADFGRGDIDILIGTQTIANGIDFLNVDNIYVVNIDNLLTLNEVTGHEKTYNLLEQVVGRVGRNSKFSTATIETDFQQHFVMEAVQSHNYYEYYKRELGLRKVSKSQPYYRICKVELSSDNQAKLLNIFSNYINDLSKAGLAVGPIQSPYLDYRFGKYRRYVLIKYKHEKVREILKRNIKYLIENNIDYNIDLNNNEIGV